MKKAINKKTKNINNLNSVLYVSLDRHWKAFQRYFRKYNKNKFKKNQSQNTVHDLRVSLRRLISILDIMAELYALYAFKTKSQLKKNSKVLLKYLDIYTELRDVQVHLSYVNRRLSKYKIKSFYTYLKNKEKILLRKTSKRSKKLEQN